MGAFRQVESAAVLRGAREPDLALQLVRFLQSPEVQRALPAENVGVSAAKNTPLPKVFALLAQAPAESATPPAKAQSPCNKNIG